jgi:hypothetical protein
MAAPAQPIRVVVHYSDGLIIKGFLPDFDPSRESFALIRREAADGDAAMQVRLAELKAVFFVEDFDGQPGYRERQEFLSTNTGRRLSVLFTDGEVLLGTSLTYHPSRKGFFLFPGDPLSNNDKVFVVAAAVTEVRAA